MRIKAFLLAALVVTPQILVSPAPALALANSREGCMNQWLFNGLWRAKVTQIEPIMDGANQTGWRVTEVWRNGTSRELAPADSSFKDQNLQLSNSSLEVEEHNSQTLVFNEMAPSGQLTYTATFFGPNMHVDPNDKPKAVDVTFDGRALSQMTSKPHFSSSQYNFHYNLGCVASGASAEAQGGSTQLAATNGCMNQWMSNGVWKMRVLAVTPFPDGTTAANQNGWHVKQEWVNVTRGKTEPRGWDVGQRVAPAFVTDEFLATQGGNNASSGNVVGGFSLGQRNIPFLPGDPYTFEQLITGGGLSAADAPTRLLVVFDTETQRKTKLSIPVPQYTMPANFRISLLCGGSVTMAPGASAMQTPQPAQPEAQQQQQQQSPAQTQSHVAGAADPCAMLGAPDVASALGVGVSSIGTAQQPSANECSWAVASHAGAPAQNVVLMMQTVQPGKPSCHGFGCISAVQSVLGSHVPGLPSQFADAFNDAQLVSGLGDKASWKNGTLTVVRADTAFQVLVHGTASPSLATSEALARDVLGRLAMP